MEDNDWHDKSPIRPATNCSLSLYGQLESDMLNQSLPPVSLRPDRRQIEETMLAEWIAGRNTSISGAIALAERNQNLRAAFPQEQGAGQREQRHAGPDPTAESFQRGPVWSV